MASSEKSLLGFAKQPHVDVTYPGGKGNAQTTDNLFKYILFSRGTAGVQNLTIPLDPEVGGGAMLRDVVKVGVTGGGVLEFVPRPDSLGMMLLGATGSVASTTAAGVSTHVFTLGTDQFAAPYYTARFAPAQMWGESIPDVRFNMVGLSWRGANFVRGQVGFIGGTPNPGLDTAAWAPSVDKTPPFITPISKIEMHDGTAMKNMKVLGGSFQSTMAIPLEEQWIVGSYSPDDFDVVSRAYVLQLAVKVTDSTLYNKILYDGNAYANAWSAEILKHANLNIEFKTASMIGATATPYSLKIEGNGSGEGAGNVAWSAQPVGLRAGSQVIMSISGIFLADATTPIKLTLVNGTAGY